MDSFISYDSKNGVNDVLEGVELDDVKLRYLNNMQKTTSFKNLDTNNDIQEKKAEHSYA
jgi:hypothetical protein